MSDSRLNPRLVDFSDEELNYELQYRRIIKEENRCKIAKCSYCGKSMSDQNECTYNPFSGYHVG